MAEKKNEKKKTLEENLDLLDKTVARLGEEDVPLDEAMQLYEEGMKLVKSCNESIDLADKKVKIIRGDGSEDEL
ncbi:MAG TPA: exodeoxyribonuclease VII small subunit [Lachnospiraceae bacterium]|nr:exodeoxyribonuclease VII small subunit [Lachnospiraceae bacterium]